MEQQFSLSWNNFHGNLSKGFAGLLGNSEFVDVTIAVEGHLLQAHKVILSICSPYFKKMFQLNPCQHPIVLLRDVSHKAMKDLLQFMYHGEVSVKREDLTAFISTAEVLQIKGLTNKQTDEDDSIEKVQTLPNHETETQNNTPDAESSTSEPNDGSTQEEISSINDLDILKQRQFIERLQRFSNLKRKSEEFLQKNYYAPEIFNFEKKQKKDKHHDKQISSTVSHNNNFSQYQQKFNDSPIDASINLSNKSDTTLNKTLKEDNDRGKVDQAAGLLCATDLKTECEESDIIVTDPAVCTTPKSYDASRDSQKDQVDYSSPQDNCSSLNSLFMDLKNLVNGKAHDHDVSRGNTLEDYSRGMIDHRLVTIPQKEDGKKKYPQRSCRLCWKIGKRRDTRFMCGACELPFCKTPCFEIHFNNMVKASQLHGYYYAT